jgi:anaerobic magnesium-protoporphyrin IX monomethyl ester cyclase
LPFALKLSKMKSPIILIGFQEQDNLGLGYIGSTLLVNGFQVKFIDYRQDKESILKIIQRNNPLIIGFSIIFQYHIYDFRDILSFLRENGINAHFSAGGHYPSLKYKELFEIVGNLDSIVLFEGEHTFLKLVRAIYNKTDWKRIEGIAFKENNNVFANNLCPLEPDLDNFPIPARPPLKEYALGKNYATLIAGRGCYYNCGFCSIQQFYKQPKGKVKRIRRPELVVEEMKYMYEKKGCQIFMFQDDDFPVNQKKEKNWISDFCKELRLQKLKNKIIWKINCRPDEIEKDNFSLMKEHGLFVVYLGIENGTDAGLKIMNKHANREQNIQAVETLKKLDIYFDFGFMLFHPWSTTESISENIDFLEIIIGDGYSPVTFCKLLPYAETAIENQLKKENRIFGITGFED